MVGQVVGAVAPVVVQSATNEEGIVNRLFKLVFIGAIIATIAVVILVLFLAFNIWEAVGGTIGEIGTFITAPLSILPGIGLLAPFFTGIVSAFTR
jgi:phosphotransferase system  glucose/maltose/N-acetylglucosamine-specific IIC component